MKKCHITSVLLAIVVISGLLLFGCDKSIDELGNNNNQGNENGNGNGSDNGNENGIVYTKDLSFTAVSNTAIKQEAGVFSGGSIYSNIYDVAYGNGKFIAVGIAGQMAHSVDGITWTAVENTGFGNRYRISSISYGNGIFVALGTWGNVIVDGKLTTIGRIVYSTNGTNWSVANTSNFDSTRITDIIFGNSKFLAMSNTGQIIYSTNGHTWTPVSDSTFGSSAISGIAYGSGRFVAVSNSVNRVAFSTDGITWTPVISSSFSGIIYSNDKFLVWGNGTIASSSDGTSWIPLANNSFTGIIYGAEKFVAWNNSSIRYSLDGGATWTDINSAFNPVNGPINNIVYENGRFVAVGGNFGNIAYSNMQTIQ